MNTTYEMQRDRLVHYYTEGFSFKDHEHLNGQFQLMSAGLVNYLPSIPYEQHAAIYQQILLHQKLSHLEQRAFDVLDYLQTEGASAAALEYLKKQAAVICTFHTGSYRVLNLLLAMHGIPFTLVMGRETAQQEGASLVALFKQVSRNRFTGQLDIIEAENPSSGLQMMRALRAGRSLVLYMDGHTGAGVTTTENNNCFVANFLGQQLYVRKGIAFLAHAAGVPLLPVMCYRKSWKDIRLRFDDFIFPDKQQTRAEFSEITTQLVYNRAAAIIAAYPAQWEGWLSVHKVACVSRKQLAAKASVSEKTGSIQLDGQRYGLFTIQGACYLLRKNTYSFFELDFILYEMLLRCADKPVAAECIEEDLLNKLTGEGILTYTR